MAYFSHTVYIEHVNPYCITPTRYTPQSAGLDVYSPFETKISPGKTVLIKLGFRLHMPVGCFGRLAERSGLALNHDIIVKGGIIDQDYEGEVGVILYNHGNKEFDIKRGHRIAQLLIQPILHPINVIGIPQPPYYDLPGKKTIPPLQENPTAHEYCLTRGREGFGSSGR